MIRFTLPKESFVSFKVYDVNGKLAADLISNEFTMQDFMINHLMLPDFLYQAEFIFILLKTSEFTETKRMVLIK